MNNYWKKNKFFIIIIVCKFKNDRTNVEFFNLKFSLRIKVTGSVKALMIALRDDKEDAEEIFKKMLNSKDDALQLVKSMQEAFKDENDCLPNVLENIFDLIYDTQDYRDEAILILGSNIDPQKFLTETMKILFKNNLKEHNIVIA